jgi:hypothetical protein
MRKAILPMAFALLCFAAPAHAGRVVNSAGSGGACVQVTTAAAVTVIAAAGDLDWRLTTTAPLNCAWGSASGAAPPVEPTTGAIGTGKGFSIGSSWNEAGAGAQLRMDCIGQTASAYVCTVEDQ